MAAEKCVSVVALGGRWRTPLGAFRRVPARWGRAVSNRFCSSEPASVGHAAFLTLVVGRRQGDTIATHDGGSWVVAVAFPLNTGATALFAAASSPSEIPRFVHHHLERHLPFGCAGIAAFLPLHKRARPHVADVRHLGRFLIAFGYPLSARTPVPRRPTARGVPPLVHRAPRVTGHCGPSR